MALIVITGRTGGTQEKVSMKSGSPKPYFVTRFSEVGSMDNVDLFGDFKIEPSDEVKEYRFEAGIQQLNFPKLLSVSAVHPVKKQEPVPAGK